MIANKTYIKSIELSNFKSYKNKSKVDFKPLTVICGVNGSGKSNLINSILLQKQSFLLKENAIQPHINTQMKVNMKGEYVDLGNFDDILFTSNTERISKDREFSVKSTFRTNSENMKNKYPTSSGIVAFDICISVTVKGLCDFLSKRYSGNIPTPHCIFKIEMIITPLDTTGMPYNENPTKIVIENLGQEIQNIEKCKIAIKEFPVIDAGMFYDCEVECYCCFANMHLMSLIFEKDEILKKYELEKQDYNNFVSIFENHVKVMYNDILKLYDGIKYISSDRTKLGRYFKFGSELDNSINNYEVGVTGENTLELLSNIIDNKVHENIYQYQIINDWFKRFDIGDLEKIYYKDDIYSINISGHNVADTGSGVNGILPILIQSLYLEDGQTLILEQPEIYLHPKYQLVLADFLIFLINNAKNVIIETHSDYIVNRIIHRIMENYDLNFCTRILLVTKNKEGISKVEDVGIDRCQGVKDSYPDFLTQYGDEVSNIVDVGFHNMLDSNNNQIKDQDSPTGDQINGKIKAISF